MGAERRRDLGQPRRHLFFFFFFLLSAQTLDVVFARSSRTPPPSTSGLLRATRFVRPRTASAQSLSQITSARLVSVHATVN